MINILEDLGKINEKPAYLDYCRVGLKRASTSRPVISLYSSDMAAQKWDIHINIYALIFPDRPVEESKAFKKISADLTEKRKSEPKGIGTMRLLLTIHYTFTFYILHFTLYTIHYTLFVSFV